MIEQVRRELASIDLDAADSFARLWSEQVEEDSDPKWLTLGELADLAEVPYQFARETAAEGLIIPKKGRDRHIRCYRRKLASWLAKLHDLRAAGMAWAEIRNWSQQRYKPGYEHERRWPSKYREAG